MYKVTLTLQCNWLPGAARDTVGGSSASSGVLQYKCLVTTWYYHALLRRVSSHPVPGRYLSQISLRQFFSPRVAARGAYLLRTSGSQSSSRCCLLSTPWHYQQARGITLVRTSQQVACHTSHFQQRTLALTLLYGLPDTEISSQIQSQ